MGPTQAGRAKNVALQQTRVEFIRRPAAVPVGEEVVEHDFSHPYYWAAFQLDGDWK